MGTRSRIACRQTNGTIRSIYCHWDGYPNGVGKMLLEHYSDYATMTRLLNRGDRSALEKVPEEGMAYIDRGDDCPAHISRSRTQLAEFDWGEEWMYLYEFETDEWFALDVYADRAIGAIHWFKLSGSKLKG